MSASPPSEIDVAKLLVFRANEESHRAQRLPAEPTTLCAVLLTAARPYMEAAVRRGAVRELPALSFLGEQIRAKLGMSNWAQGWHGFGRPNSTESAVAELNTFLKNRGYKQVTGDDMRNMLIIWGQCESGFLDNHVQRVTRAIFRPKEKRAIQLCNEYKYISAMEGLDYKNW